MLLYHWFCLYKTKPWYRTKINLIGISVTSFIIHILFKGKNYFCLLYNNLFNLQASTIYMGSINSAGKNITMSKSLSRNYQGLLVKCDNLYRHNLLMSIILQKKYDAILLSVYHTVFNFVKIYKNLKSKFFYFFLS